MPTDKCWLLTPEGDVLNLDHISAISVREQPDVWQVVIEVNVGSTKGATRTYTLSPFKDENTAKQYVRRLIGRIQVKMYTSGRPALVEVPTLTDDEKPAEKGE